MNSPVKHFAVLAGHALCFALFVYWLVTSLHHHEYGMASLCLMLAVFTLAASVEFTRKMTQSTQIGE